MPNDCVGYPGDHGPPNCRAGRAVAAPTCWSDSAGWACAAAACSAAWACLDAGAKHVCPARCGPVCCRRGRTQWSTAAARPWPRPSPPSGPELRTPARAEAGLERSGGHGKHRQHLQLLRLALAPHAVVVTMLSADDPAPTSLRSRPAATAGRPVGSPGQRLRARIGGPQPPRGVSAAVDGLAPAS